LPLPEYRRERDIALPDKIGKPQTAAAKGQDKMNTAVGEQIGQAYQGIWYAILLAVALYFLKVILSIAFKGRLAPGLAPDLSEVGSPTFLTRILSLVGHKAPIRQTLGTVRLRATFGLLIAYWGGLAALIYIAHGMQAPVIGIEGLISLAVFVTALHTSLYEITYDKVDVTLPRWWFGRTIHHWRDLDAVTDKDPWMVTLHFADGRRVKVHKYIVGHAEFMAVARGAIRNS
jgi:hypothetical protein